MMEEKKENLHSISLSGTEYRAYVRRLCSVIGFALCLLFLLMQVMGLGAGLLIELLKDSDPAGIGGLIYRIMTSEWFTIAGLNFLCYGLTLPLMLFLLRNVPEIKMEPKRMHPHKFIMFLVLAMGTGYMLNIAGTLLNLFIALLTSRTIEDMNPVNDIMNQLGPATVLYVAVIGPIFEELIFRKMILNRVRPLGEKAAILFSAVLFGLLHGNIAQFFYATFIGIILGYAAVKTGRIFYSILLHIIINSFSVMVSLILIWGFENPLFLLVFSLVVMALFFGMIVASIVLLGVNAGKTRLKRGNAPEGIEYRDFSPAMFLNPGVLSFMTLCVLTILFYAFIA